MKRARSRPDESLLQQAGVSAIFDARPMRNALGNMVMGKGYEVAARYGGARVAFLGARAGVVRVESLTCSGVQTLKTFMSCGTATLGCARYAVRGRKARASRRVPLRRQPLAGWQRWTTLGVMGCACRRHCAALIAWLSRRDATEQVVAPRGCAAAGRASHCRASAHGGR